MPGIEITQLRLKEITADDPALLNNLSLVRDKLQTDSRFFCCAEDPSLIYIFGIWTSLDAHLEFLASPACSEVLGPQEDMLRFEWTIHLETADVPHLLLKSPFVAIQRLEVDAVHVDRYNEAISKHLQALQFPGLVEIRHEWRCDAPIRNLQSVILTSWGSEIWCNIDVRKDIAFASTDGSRDILLHHAWNIEHTRFGPKKTQN